MIKRENEGNLHRLQNIIKSSRKLKYLSIKSKSSCLFKICVFFLISCLIIAIPIFLFAFKILNKDPSPSKPIQNLNYFSSDISRKFFQNQSHQLVYIQSNNLKLILIDSEEQTQTSSASLLVSSGYLSDPPNQQGLSLLLERMLFLGSSFFPSDVWKKSMTANGESYQSQTSASSQIYSFSTQNSHFLKRLEQWISFFQDPLLPFVSLENELDKLIKEISYKMKSQDYQFESILHEVSEKNHPFHIQGIEDLNDMALNLNRTYIGLQNYFKSHYYSENMVFVIKTNQFIIDKLQNQYLVQLFKSIPSKDAQHNSSIQSNNSLPIKGPLYVEVFNEIKVNKLYLSTIISTSQEDNSLTLDFIKDIIKYGYSNTSLCSMIEDFTQGRQCALKIQKERNDYYSLDKITLEIQFLEKNNIIQEVAQIYFHFMKSIKESKNIKQLFELMQTMRRSYTNVYGSPIISDIQQIQQITQMMKYKKINNNNLFDQGTEVLDQQQFNKYINILSDPSQLIIMLMTDSLTLSSNLSSNSTAEQGKIQKLRYSKNEFVILEYPDLFNPALQLPKLIEKEMKKDNSSKPNLKQQINAESKLECLQKNNQGFAVLMKSLNSQKLPLQEIRLEFQNNQFQQNITYQSVYYIFTEKIEKQINKTINELSTKIIINPVQSYSGFSIDVQMPSAHSQNTLEAVMNILSETHSSLLSNEQEFLKSKNNTLNSLKIKHLTMDTEEIFSQILESLLYMRVFTIDFVIDKLEQLQFEEFSEILESFLKKQHLFISAFGHINPIQIENIFEHFHQTPKVEHYIHSDVFIKYIPKSDHQTVIVNNPNVNILGNTIGNFYLIGEIDPKQQEEFIYPFLEKIQEYAMKYLFNQQNMDCKIQTQLLNHFNVIGFLILARDCTSHIPLSISNNMDEFIKYLIQQFTNTSHQEYSNIVKAYRSQQQQISSNFFENASIFFTHTVQNYFKPLNQIPFEKESNQLGQFYSFYLSKYNKLSIRIQKNNKSEDSNFHLIDQISTCKQDISYYQVNLQLNTNECKNLI